MDKNPFLDQQKLPDSAGSLLTITDRNPLPIQQTLLDTAGNLLDTKNQTVESTLDECSNKG